MLLILGVTPTIHPMPGPRAALTVDLPVMTAFAVLLWLVVANGMRVHRWEGALLLAAYASFIGWQVAAAG
jgi:cation:H+ antiporter